jgi:hypothetical protein
LELRLKAGEGNFPKTVGIGAAAERSRSYSVQHEA